jgi:hypothetical protein
MRPLDLIDFKYVYCPALQKEIRLKRAYTWSESQGAGSKTLVGCTGAFVCGAGRVADGKVRHDFSRCPFQGVRFMENRKTG